MSMTSYEVVRRAIEFQNPDRLPLRLEVPIPTRSGGSMEGDVQDVRWNFIGTGDRNVRQSYDEWGCLWVRSAQENMGQVKGHPLAEWAALDTYRWPDPDAPAFYEGMEERLAGADGKYVITGIFMVLFERMQALRGFENTLLDLHLERERIEMLADRIVEFDLRIIQNIAERFPGQIHGCWFTEDWGTQQALMINPMLWREFFKPRYVSILEAIHAAGWHAWMHSDGRINAILEDLVEIGVDVINLQQPRVLGIEEVGRQLKGRICFETLCDIQHTLPSKSGEEIRAEARLLVEQWAAPNGGFIVSIDENDKDLGLPIETTQVMLEAFLEADPWSVI